MVDRGTMVTEFEPIQSKGEVYRGVDHWTRKHRRFRCAKSDNGGEFIGHKFLAKLREVDAKQKLTSKMNSKSNGEAEVENKLICGGIRTLLTASGLDKRYWGFAGKYLCHMINCHPRRRLRGLTPFQKAGRDPDPRQKIPFGARVMYHIGELSKDKLQNRFLQGTFLGYHDYRNDYLVLPDSGPAGKARRAREVRTMSDSSRGDNMSPSDDLVAAAHPQEGLSQTAPTNISKTVPHAINTLTTRSSVTSCVTSVSTQTWVIWMMTMEQTH